MTIYKHFCKTLFLVGISLSFSLYADQQLEVLEVKTSQSYEISKNLPGELLPFQQSKIAFEITGRISSIFVDIGDRVKKDEVLAKLDDSEVNANLEQAVARLDLANQVLNRFEDLRKKGFISIQDFDKAKSEYLVAKSQVKFFEVKKSQTILRAPYDGFIQNRFVDEGTVINGSNPILEILDANKVEAHVSIPENLVNNLEVSNDYVFEIGQEKAKGKFKRLAPMSASGSNSRLAIFEFSDFFIPGSVIDLIIKIKKSEQGIWLPINSLSQSEQGLWSVYTVSDDGSNRVEKDLVRILHFENNYAYVSGTLKDGDLVILGGLSKIIEGQTL
jgi:RND family efflux transporter MFP subunit|tara:strand:+ start:1357 stop:2349 length:993 start_codon:yes stop_codon:yes gene_type:complete